MRNGRNGQSAAHFFDKLRALSAKTIPKVSTPAECKILVEEIRCYLLSAFIHGKGRPVGK
jgi:hypothetical protein